MDEVIYFQREMVKPMMKEMTAVVQQGTEFVEKKLERLSFPFMATEVDGKASLERVSFLHHFPVCLWYQTIHFFLQVLCTHRF